MAANPQRGQGSTFLSPLRAIKRHWKCESKGQALVELALIMPILLFLLLIVIDFGRLFASYVEIANASREGAAYAAGNPTDLPGISVRAAAETNSQSQAGQGALVVTATCASSGGQPIDCASAAGGSGVGSSVTVTTSERFTFLTPLISGFFSGGVALSSSTTAVVLSLAASGGDTPGNCTTAPRAAFTVSVNGRTVTLDASGSSPTTGICAIAGYNWDMGDGANPFPPVVGRNVTYTYSMDGQYRIFLLVSNPAGSDQETQEISIGNSASPTATPSLTPPPGPTPAPTTPPPVCSTAPSFTYAFTGTGSGTKAHQITFYGGYTGQPDPASWTWDFGDGSSPGSGQTTDHDYKDAGTYTVTLTVRNGGCTATTTQQVVVP
jgi:PKD repeat protein